VPNAKRSRKGRGWVKALLAVSMVVLMAAATYASYAIVMDLMDGSSTRKGFSSKDLKAPLPSAWTDTSDRSPTFIRSGPAPPYSFSISFPVNGTTKRLEAIPGLGGIVNLTILNDGPTDIFIEDVDVSTGWGHAERVAVGRQVDHGEARYVRHLMLPLPAPSPPEEELEFSLSFDVLVGPLISGSSWTRREGVEFGVNKVQPYALFNATDVPDVVMNRVVVFDRAAPKVEKDLPLLKALASNISGDDAYTVNDLVDAALYLEGSLEYRSDPEGEDAWSSPSQTLEAGGGDCEDWSLLYAGIVTAMGGSARLMLNGRHVMCAVYIGDEGSVLDPVIDRFGADLPLLVYEDRLGKWLIVDPQGGPCFGWFPVNIAPTDAPVEGQYIHNHPGSGWAFTDTEFLYIVDIYLN
jgi:hypothetical protein